MRWLLFAWIVVFQPFATSGQDSPLKVERVLWGFDGQAVVEAFNPLTLEVANVSSDPYQGSIQLERRLGSSLSGVPEIQTISVAPGGTRVIQFTPYIEQHQYHDWRISWRGGRHDLEEAPAGTQRGQARGVVELMSQEWLQQNSQTSLPKFPEHYFPTNPSATRGLHTVILAHQPDWGVARAESFLLWLKRGGTLHLYPGPDAQTIQFEGSLVSLNAARSSGTLGNGTIIPHDQRPASDHTALATNNPTQPPSSEERKAAWRAFGQSTLPEVPWGWVYLAAFVYLALIGPGHYLFARGKHRDYRKIILTLLACVGVFAWLFAMIGRRGYVGADRWLSASIAYSLQDGTYDVEQWAHAFVTKGNSYDFRMAETNALFSVQHQKDRIPGFIRGGPQGYLQLDLPLNSSRNLHSRAVLSGPKIDADIISWNAATGDLETKLNADFEISEMWLHQNDQIIGMRPNHGTWVSGDRDQEIMEADIRSYRYNRRRDIGELKLNFQKWLTSRHRKTHQQQSASTSQAELLIWASPPESFRPSSPTFDTYEGYVLYVIPISTSSSP